MGRWFLLLLILCGSCSSNKARLRDSKGSYLENAKLNFDAGLSALAKSEFDNALGYFQFVKSKYPFSKYSALSDLKIADTKYLQKKWLEAASAYEIFVRLHPRNEEVDYASYRIGLSYFFAIPADFFLVPSSTSRDQSSTKEALHAIDRFLLSFPNSEYVPDAKDKQKILYTKLAQHNMHIADYYQRRGEFKAAIERFLSINNLYPESTEAVDGLVRATGILMNLGEYGRAMELNSMVLEKDPSNTAALKQLDSLKAKMPSE